MSDRYPVIRQCWLVVWLLASLPLAAWSADPNTFLSDYHDQQNEPLSLGDAIDEALQHNTAVRIARARVEEERGNKRHASRWVPTNPVLEVETAEREAPDNTSTDLGIRLSQEFWIGGQGGLAEASAEALLSASRSRLRFLEAAHAARTRRAFLSLLWAQQSVATAERLVEVNREFATYARKRLDAGKSTAMELNTATIGQTRAQAELADAKRDQNRARLALADMLSRDPTAPLRVTGTLQPWSLSLPPETELLNKSVQQRQDLIAAGQSVEAARRELQLSRRQLIPNLTLFGFYEEEENAEITGGGISLPLPILHRYGGERQVAAARLQQQQLAEEELQLAVRRQVLGAIADYQSAADRIALLGEQTLARAEENVSLVQQAFRAGKVGAPAVTSTQDNLIAVRRSYLTALHDLVVAVTDLERASGGLIQVTTAPAASGQSQ